MKTNNEKSIQQKKDLIEEIKEMENKFTDEYLDNLGDNIADAETGQLIDAYPENIENEQKLIDDYLDEQNRLADEYLDQIEKEQKATNDLIEKYLKRHGID